MAAGNASAGRGKANLQEHPLVQALVPDPSQPAPDATVLRGFLGKGTDSGAWRLYLTPTLDEYVEIPESDILHVEDLPDDRGSLVWVPKSLDLQHVQTQARKVQAEMLSGPLASAGLFAAAAASTQQLPIAQPRLLPSQPPLMCPTPTAVMQCPSHLCPSPVTPCGHPSLQCPSEPIVRCPTSTGPCHSQTVVCAQPTVHSPCVTLGPACGPTYSAFCRPSIEGPCLSATVPCPPSVHVHCGPSVTVPCGVSATAPCGTYAVACRPPSIEYCPPTGQNVFCGAPSIPQCPVPSEVCPSGVMCGDPGGGGGVDPAAAAGTG
jgi:hypothetical protein